MTCRLVVQPEAERDLSEAYRWYENQHSGLGREFIECVETVFERIREMPELHAVAYRNVRHALVRRFPYVVCYLFEEERINVVAVFHGHRDPNAWKLRVDGGATNAEYDN